MELSGACLDKVIQQLEDLRNSGTWTAVIVHDEELVRDVRQFVFVRVVGDTAHLMRWNDGGGDWEPIVLH